ncbi:aldehyde ferredoxin oxidoreductase family protein [Desulfosporosinus sp.]|uniref:aldehyde ferredoxin oxidoreductase family protein n=1 Tax=Desulfosporosinus sp. TaxID=157907 RepID=UPI0025BD9AF4|nr:aldehyde ferredoxin oxidoreductase family protein [Desulfosporosinus sp.]MBC2723211.1 aldehyde ferredoxin oxidoreductase family protein [Desulfosporosinus sp.]MBC2726684.1 aldehyde ferredoxin oxidoreductase family protein [Desulfosporosinus sp.]
MGGYRGRILRVNLTDKCIMLEELKLELAKKYLGGRGLAGKMFTEEVPTEVDAFSPENKVFIAAGTLTGTKAPTSGRFMVVTKSPLNGTIAASNSGGFWGPQLKFAGYDMVVLEGKADAPVYLSIEDDKIEIKDAAHIWGKDVYETTSILKAEFGDDQAKVLTIGPAGENLSFMASVMNDLYRAAGRNGVGAVLGSKNIKAIIVRGTGRVEHAEPNALNEVLTDVLNKIQENGVTSQGLPTYGTAILVNIMNENGVYPVNNFQESYNENADELSGETMTEKYLVKKESCYRCPIACGRYCNWEEGEGGGPEYESVWVFGSNCGVQDYQAIHQANDLCNRFGLDTISVGATIATGMELFQRGYIKTEELEGTPLEFGHAQGMVEWIRKIAYREGLGAKMALGSYRLAKGYGAAELSMSVKKQELPACDPRGVQGQGLSYATSNRGGCHVRGYSIPPEILGTAEKPDRFSIKGKAKTVKASQDLSAVIDSVGLCLFSSFALGLSDYKKLINAITGFDYTDEELLACGERVWNNERLHNLRIGYTKADDTLPKRFLKEPIPSGPSKGHVHRIEELLPEYYTVRGWTPDGVPSSEHLNALGM